MAEIPANLWPHAGPAPKVEHVLGQVAGLLKDLGYSKTSSALEKEALKKSGLTKLDPTDGLLNLYSSSSAVASTSDDSDADSESSDSDSDDSDDESEKDEVEAALVDVEAEETSDDSSDEDSSDSEPAAKVVESSTKRKRVATPSSSGSSSSEDDSSSSSDDSDARPAKRSKVAETKAGASHSDSSSSDSSSDESSSSDSDSSSSESAADDSSDSDSSSSSSDDSSSSESESESEPAPPPVKVKKEKKEKKEKAAIVPVAIPKVEAKDNGSQSSATLQGDSPEVEEAAEDMSGIHPDRLKQSQFAPTTRKEGAANAKKAVVPFSRIPADQKIDPRFNMDYVSYDYADKAYQDLVVTKGKGFTKEKNKKKRGSYRGGAIDLAPKGIKFDD